MPLSNLLTMIARKAARALAILPALPIARRLSGESMKVHPTATALNSRSEIATWSMPPMVLANKSSVARTFVKQHNQSWTPVVTTREATVPTTVTLATSLSTTELLRSSKKRLDDASRDLTCGLGSLFHWEEDLRTERKRRRPCFAF